MASRWLVEPLEERCLLSDVTFTQLPVGYPTGSGPYSVMAADFNGDGKIDLAVANMASDTVSLLLGNGSGGFGVKTDFATGDMPWSVTATDFNGDGRIDLAVANGGVSFVSVLLGDGSGGFSRTDIAAGIGSRSVTAADFNGDGKMDLATASPGMDTVSVLLGNDRGFGPKTDFATFSEPIFVTAADLNSDGKSDLAIVNSFNGINTVSLLLGDGSGGFGVKTDFATGSDPRSVAAADFNGDGKIDLAVANQSSHTVSVLLGNGGGGFDAKTDFATDSYPYSVIAADFNGDGKMDLATANINSDIVSVLLGNGSGGFGAKMDFITGSYPRSVTAADFNGDGRIDLAVANMASNTVTVLLNTPNQPPTASAGGAYVIGQGLPLTLIASASDPDEDLLTYAWDVNGDGNYTDAVGVSPTLSWTQLQALGLAPGVYSNLRVRVSDDHGNSIVSTAAQLTIRWAGDANEDGKVSFWDYLVLEYNYGKTGRTWTDADFNGDGKVSFADYLLLEQNFGKSITVPAPPAPSPALAPMATALAVPTNMAAKMASPDAVQSVQAQTMTLIGWNSGAIRPVKSSRLLRQVDSSLARSLLALDRLI